jgi:hypothetical protein
MDEMSDKQTSNEPIMTPQEAATAQSNNMELLRIKTGYNQHTSPFH